MSSASDFIIENGVLKKYVGPGGDVVVPDGVTEIGSRAFYECGSLRSVTIPEGVTSIDQFSFCYCQNLVHVTIPDSVVDNINPFYRCNRVLIKIKDIAKLYPHDRPRAAVCFAIDSGRADDPRYESHCKYIKANASKLVDVALRNRALLSLMCREKLITPKNVELYVEAAQKTGNAELIAVMLEYQANKISTKQKENMEKRKEKEQDTIIDRMIARQGKNGIEGLNIVVTGKLETFANRDEFKAYLVEKGAKLASSLTSKVDYLIMNDPKSDSAKAEKAQALGIEVISEGRFNEIVGREFQIEEAVLEKYRGADGDVTIPDSVTSIGDSAFSDCSGLTSMTIPEGVTNIGNHAFRGCRGLTSVMIPDSVTSIGDSAFWGCRGLTSVMIPEDVTSIGDSAFAWCCGVTSITIPESVTSIGKDAFYACYALTIHAPSGSYAEQYAKENNIPFVAE